MGSFGLIGKKLGHSFSPEIHRLIGDYEYGLYELEQDEVERFFKNTALDGFNVTIPYKEKAFSLCDRLSPGAKASGSVNTVIRQKDGLFYGDNTDIAGFLSLFNKHRGSFAGGGDAEAVVLGSGGASKAVCLALDGETVNYTVISRRGVGNNYSNLSSHRGAGLIINATPVGMFPGNGETLININDFPNCGLVIDLIYNPLKTRLVFDAQERGVAAAGGLGMLVTQAIKAAELFTGKKYGERLYEEILQRLYDKIKNIVLIGMPGSGKTSVGKRLAELTGRSFFDIDGIIEKKAGMKITEIFKTMGEDGFRKLESQEIADTTKLRSAVIATGGGAVTVPQNKYQLKQNGVVALITRKTSELCADGRPLSALKGVEALFAERSRLYDEWADAAFLNEDILQTALKIKEECNL